MTLCDQNGYRLASHYKVSSAIDDSAVLFAITDQYGATCSQRNMGYVTDMRDQWICAKMPSMDPLLVRLSIDRAIID